MLKLCLLTLCLLAFSRSNAQDTYVPLDQDIYRIIDRYEIKHGKKLTGLHTSIRPYGRQEVAELAEEAERNPDGLSPADRFNLDICRAPATPTAPRGRTTRRCSKRSCPSRRPWG